MEPIEAGERMELGSELACVTISLDLPDPIPVPVFPLSVGCVGRVPDLYHAAEFPHPWAAPERLSTFWELSTPDFFLELCFLVPSSCPVPRFKARDRTKPGYSFESSSWIVGTCRGFDLITYSGDLLALVTRTCRRSIQLVRRLHIEFRRHYPKLFLERTCS